jgi:hypothetical protein
MRHTLAVVLSITLLLAACGDDGEGGAVGPIAPDQALAVFDEAAAVAANGPYPAAELSARESTRAGPAAP